MPHVVTSGCDCSTHTCPCVDVCPVVSFRTDSKRMVIDPAECIDCTMCAEECIEGAVLSDQILPPSELDQLDFNRDAAAEWPAAN